uniref:Bacteriocin BAC79 (Fragments) n=1 Tax=Weissella confusa TaxID=1583 RepID=BAC79_WEICO|nr:RecName: Full=Bacteriocin BAC79 [Weissella confusa]
AIAVELARDVFEAIQTLSRGSVFQDMPLVSNKELMDLR